MELVKFWWEPQELMKFEQEDHACTWIIDQLMKRIWSYKFESLLDLLQELDSTLIEFLTLVYLELSSITWLTLD
jgi:hypothetical protein